MLTTIHITVCDRVPTITAGEDVISHNSDYVAEFEFDEEWQDKVKTVYFVCEDGSYQAVVMSGNSCDVPMMAGEHRRIFVGVQAGSAEKPSVLKTTRPCCLKVKDSIADYLGQPIPDPAPDVYEQIIAMLNNLTTPTWETVQNKPFTTLGGGLEVDENGVLSAEGGSGSDNAVQYVAQTLTDEQKAQARENIGASPIPSVSTWKSDNYDDVFDLYGMHVGYGIVSGYNHGDSPNGMTLPALVIFGYMSYGQVTTTVYDGAGVVWRGTLYLSSETYSDFTKQTDYVTNTALKDILKDYISFLAFTDALQKIGQAIGTKLDKNQGTDNAGKILGIGEDGIVTPEDKPTYTLTDADKTAVAEEVVAGGIAATLTDLPSGGGGGEKEWTKILETEVTEATATFEVTGLDNYTEFLAINSGLQNATSTDSAQNLFINEIQVCVNFVDVRKSGVTAYNYAIAKFNGIVWECHKPNVAISATNLTPSTAYIPYNVVLGVGKATSIKMATANTTYAPVSGKITIYGR
jgi:hypothetical protein